MDFLEFNSNLMLNMMVRSAPRPLGSKFAALNGDNIKCLIYCIGIHGRLFILFQNLDFKSLPFI